jgi:hypothetical protein
MPVRYNRRSNTMRFMVMHYSTPDNEAGIPPSPEQIAAIGAQMQEIAMTGVLLGGEGVHPSSMGVRLDFTSGDARVIDGPFAEAKEVIAGFAIVDVQTRDEAVEIAKKFAAVTGTPRIDIRQIVEYSDLP